MVPRPQTCPLPSQLPSVARATGWTRRTGQSGTGSSLSFTTEHGERRPSPHLQDSQLGEHLAGLWPPPREALPLWEATGSVRVWRTLGREVATEASSPGQQVPAAFLIPWPEAAFPSFLGTPSHCTPKH